MINPEAVLILGASSLQVPLIQFVKKKGYYVIVASIPGDYPGFALANKVIYLDVRDTNGIYDSVKDYNIVSVLTDETDISVPTVAKLSKKLGLAGNNPSVATIYSNKFLMRELCKKIHISVPNFVRLSDCFNVKKLNSIQFPAIMKPEDNQGSRGIFKVYSYDDIKQHFAESMSFSKTGNVIIEDYFEGKEVVCEGFVINGEYLNWGFADRNYFNIKGTFIPCQTLFPSLLSKDIKEKLLIAEEKIHKELKPSFGMVHSEYLYNETTKEYVLVETALRGGGVYISSHLIPYYTSFNNYELLFSCSLGNYHNLSEVSSMIHPMSSGYVCFTLPEGEIVSIEGIDELKNIPEVKLIDLDNLHVGMHTKKMINKTMRMGPIIIAASNREELNMCVKKVKEKLKINVRCVDNILKGIVWE